MNFTMKTVSVIALAATMTGEAMAESINITGTEGNYQVTTNLQAKESEQTQHPAVDDSYGPEEKSSQLPSGSVSIENKSRSRLLQLMINANSRRDGDETTYPVGLEVTYGQLFSKTAADDYNGFYRLTSKIDSDSTLRINASSGYYVPFTGGEAMLSYRLLSSRLRDSFDLTGDFEESALEHGFALSYNHYFDTFIHSLGTDISYTDLSGKRIDKLIESDIAGIWSTAQTATGFGDVETGAVTLTTAMGSEGWDHSFFHGLRLDLDAGYEEVRYDAFGSIPEAKDSGYTASATATLNTIIGQASMGYHTGEASAITSLSLGSSALKLYFRDIDYHMGNKETVYGLSLTGSLDELLHPGRYLSSIFNSTESLFPENSGSYKNISGTRHAAKFTNDQFIAKPKIHSSRQNVFVVDKNALPPNVHLDTTRQVLTVVTQSQLSSIISVNPGSAASAFSIINGRMEIAISRLPVQTQTITAKALETDGGETWVSIRTSVGSLHIDSVSVRENQNIQIEAPPVTTPEPESGGGATTPDPEEPAENQPPVAVMNLHYYSTDGLEIGLYGIQSYDPEDGAVSSYLWSTTDDCRAEPHWFLPGPGVRTVKKTTSDVVCVVTLEVCDSEGLCGDKTYTW